VITYRATLDVPDHTLAFVARILAAHRRRTDRRPWQRAAAAYTQALVLRWFRDGTALAALARDARVSVATAYRYLHEGIDVIAAHAPDLHDVLERGIESGWEHVCLDGTLVVSTRCRERSESGHDLWYSGTHRRHGGNVQVLTDPTGHRLWVSDVAPGSVHDLTAARHGGILGALYPAAVAGMPILADKGYTGAGIGVHVPTKGRDLDAGTRCRNTVLSAMRAPAERANALLKTRRKALQRISLCPWRIGSVVAAALVLLHLQAPSW
jgi:hypothetical protein